MISQELLNDLQKYIDEHYIPNEERKENIMAKDARLKPMSTFRIYYTIGEESTDMYIEAYSAQDAVDRILAMDPEAKIIDVAKIVKNWTQHRKVY